MRSEVFRNALTMNMGTFQLQEFLNNLNREVEKLHVENGRSTGEPLVNSVVENYNVIRINLLEDIIETLEFYV
jgi:hypothetical protein